MRLYEEPLRADQEYESVATAIEEVRSSLQGTFHGNLLGPADPGRRFNGIRNCSRLPYRLVLYIGRVWDRDTEDGCDQGMLCR